MEEKEWSGWSYDCKGVDGQFLDGPGWIRKLTLVANGTNATSAAFYDGHTTSGKHLITMRAPKNSTRSVDFETPFKVNQGLYVDVGTNIECVTAQYKKMKP